MWDNLNLHQKNELMKLYIQNGITSLDEIKKHYNSFDDGGKLTFQQWKAQMQSKYPDIEMDNNKAGYDYETYFNDNYDEAVAQLSNLQHFPDTYKLYNHPTFSNESIYSRGPMIGGSWGYNKPWETQWGGTEAFRPSIVNQQVYPNIYKEDRPYTEEEIYGHKFDTGGPTKNGKPAGWDPFTYEEYTKLGLPMSKTEKQLRALRDIATDNPDYYTDLTGKDAFFVKNLEPVNIEAEHPLKDYPGINWDNPYVRQNARALLNFIKDYNRAGLEYMKWATPVAMAPVGPIASRALSGLGALSGATNFTKNLFTAGTPANTVASQIATSTAAMTGGDLLSQWLSGKTFEENVSEAVENVTGWNPSESLVGSLAVNTLNPLGYTPTEVVKNIFNGAIDVTANTTRKLFNNIYNNIYKSNNTLTPSLRESENKGIQFIRALGTVPKVNEKGFVELVPQNNALANFATDMRAASHKSYKDLHDLPSLMFIDESQLKGITPFSIKPSDTFFRANDLKDKFRPQNITYWSSEEALNNEARKLGFNVPETPSNLLAAKEAFEASVKRPVENSGKKSLLDNLVKSDAERGDKQLYEEYEKLRRNFEQSLYRRPSIEDYRRLENKTGLQSDVVESDISKLEKVIDEYTAAKGNLSKVTELYEKYGDEPIVTLSDGSTFGHEDLMTLTFDTDNTVGEKLAEMMNANIDSRYSKIYYDKASPIEAQLMKSIGMGQHPRLIDGRVVGAKGKGNMSLDEFNEALDNLIKTLGAKPLAKGGLLK